MEFVSKLVSQSDNKYLYFMTPYCFLDLFRGSTATVGPRPLHCRGFAITLRHTTNGKTSLDE